MPYGIGTSRLDPWLELAAEANGIGFFDWNVTEDRLAWNSGAETRLGLAPGTINSFAAWANHVPPNDVAHIQLAIADAVAARADYLSFRYTFTGGEATPTLFEGRAQCFYTGSELSRMVGVNVDVGPRERQRRELELREQTIEAILQTVPDAIIVFGANGIIVRVNRAAVDLFDSTEASMAGAPAETYVPLVLNQYRRGDAATDAEPSIVGRTRDLHAIRADGSKLPIELRIGRMRLANTPWFVAVIRDVTERENAKRALDTLRDRFARAARLSATGEMAVGLAHEINQPLAAGTNFLAAAQLHLRQSGAVAPTQDNLDRAREELTRASEIVRRLRRYVAGATTVPAWHALRPLVDESLTLSLVRSEFDNLMVEVAIDPGIQVCIDKGEMQQVLVNLMRNAADAMAEAQPAQPELTIHAVRDDDMVELTITDNGTGFSPHVLAAITMPFFTTKPGHGLGLGLAIVRRLVEGQGGTVEVSNAPEGGGRVQLRLRDGDDEGRADAVADAGRS